MENPIYFLVFRCIKFSLRTFDRIQTVDGFDKAERTTAKDMLVDEVKCDDMAKRWQQNINNNMHNI